MTYAEKLDAGIAAMKAALEVMGDGDFGDLGFGRTDFSISIHCHEKDPAKLHEIRRAIGLSKITKEYYEGTMGPVAAWEGNTPYGRASMNVHGLCTIQGWEEKVIPAQPERVERKAIYKCT